MLDKNNNFSLDAQGVANDLYVDFLKTAYNSAILGIKESFIDFSKDPCQFDYRSAKAIWMNSKIKKLFLINFESNSGLKRKIYRIKSHGVDYYVLDGKVLVCFKKMNSKSRINSLKTKRFTDSLTNEKVQYSKAMLDVLTEMGINKALPIYYVGHVLDKSGQTLEDVRLVRYENSEPVYVKSLKEAFSENLFSINYSINQDDSDIKVTSKKQKREIKTGS